MHSPHAQRSVPIKRSKQPLPAFMNKKAQNNQIYGVLTFRSNFGIYFFYSDRSSSYVLQRPHQNVIWQLNAEMICLRTAAAFNTRLMIPSIQINVTATENTMVFRMCPNIVTYTHKHTSLSTTDDYHSHNDTSVSTRRASQRQLQGTGYYVQHLNLNWLDDAITLCSCTTQLQYKLHSQPWHPEMWNSKLLLRQAVGIPRLGIRPSQGQ